MRRLIASWRDAKRPRPNSPSWPLTSFTLPDGREVVLLDVVIARETVVAKYVLKGREAWFRCRQPVKYTIDWIAGATAPK